MKSFLSKIYHALHFPKSFQLFLMGFIQDRFLVGVTAIVLNDKNEVLLVKHSYRAHSWSLPGGYLKAGEHPQEGLEREIKEETGLVVSIEQSVRILTDRDMARLDLAYKGVFIGGEFAPTHEVSECGFFAMDKLPLLRQNQVFLINDILRP